MATLKLKVMPKFPAQVLGGDGITITQSGGVYTISFSTTFGSGLYALLAGGNAFTGVQVITTNSNAAGLSLNSGSSSFNSNIGIGRTADELKVGIAGSVDAYVTGTVAGDAGIVNAAGSIWLAGAASTPGIKIANNGVLRFPQHTSGTLIVNATGVVSANTETGSGNSVRATSPTLTTPALGVATATGITITTGSASAGLNVLSGSASFNSNANYGRTGGELQVGVVGTVDNFFTGTVASDAVFRANGGGVVWLGSTSAGIKISAAGALTFPQHVSGKLAVNGSGVVSVTNTLIVTVKRQVFTGNGTYTPSAGMQYCRVQAWGGGGGGGGGASTSGTEVAFAAGGGAGGYCDEVYSAATIGASQAVTIGALGAGGTAGANNGSAGANTTLGALLTAVGGSGGSGAAAATTGSFNNGGLGGTGTVGGTAVASMAGFAGWGIVAASNGVSGAGGSSMMGGGGRGVFANSAGQAATGLGSGGSGAARGTSAATAAGGDGKAGYMVVTEFCNQ